MIELYHGSSSVCSSKVRIGLAEKEIEWVSHPINLAQGEQNQPFYLALNPNGVVPTLVDQGLAVTESSVILEYVDSLTPDNRLMPSNRSDEVRAKMYLARCIDIHAAINTLTFTTVNRQRILAKKSPEDIETSIKAMANPANASKRRDVLKNGLDSDFMLSAFFILRRLFADMQKNLENSKWLLNESYSIADTAIISYIDRLERLGLSGMWQSEFSEIERWLVQSRARPSYEKALNAYISTSDADSMREDGLKMWPDVKTRWEVAP